MPTLADCLGKSLLQRPYQNRLLELQEQYALEHGQERGALRALESLRGDVEGELKQLFGQLGVEYPVLAPAAKPGTPKTAPVAAASARGNWDAEYESAQKKIDEIENRLEQQGIDVARLVDPADESADVLMRPGKYGGWKEMPPDLIAAYTLRDAAGAEMLKVGREGLRQAIAESGVTLSKAAADQILEYYAIHPTSDAAVNQVHAFEHSKRTGTGDLRQQLEDLSIILKLDRGGKIDDVGDLDGATIREAGRLMKSVNRFFGVEYPTAAKPEFAPPDQAADFNLETVTPEQLKAEEAARQKADLEQKQREEIARRQAAPLTGDSTDVGQGALFQEDANLFSGPSAEQAASRPSSAMGDPASPQGQYGLPSALPPGTPTATSFKRMLVAMERVAPGTTTVAKVVERLRAVVDLDLGVEGATPVRTGRFSKRYAGVYKEGPKVIRVWDLLNIPTTAHEVAHALADALYGTAHSRGIKPVLPKDVAKELHALGVALYGKTRPAAGYIAEGWAEMVSDYLTSDQVRAPKSVDWLENTLLPTLPEVAGALKAARNEIDIWRGMGARERLKAQTRLPPGRWAAEAKSAVSRKNWVEELAPLEKLVEGVRKYAGQKLKPDQDPFLIASARRGTAGGVLEQMVDSGMIDPAGNVTGRSLREALAPVTAGLKGWQIFRRKERASQFWDYLRARRSIERWAKGMNPGMTLADAQYLKTNLETPDFQLAAANYYQWWDGVLDYLAEASPTNRALVAAIRAGSSDYVPLARYIDPAGAKPGAATQASNALRRMFGSSREVLPVDMQTMLTAESLIARAHRDQVLDAIFQLQRYEGVGPLLEEVPVARVQQTVDIAKLRKELDAMGVDTTGVPDGTLLEFYQPADTPKGQDPIIARTVNGQTRWYHVPAELYETLQGLQPARLPFVFDLLFGAPARAFRLGTTGLRPGFALVTNPIRDFATFLLQSNTDTNPLRRTAEYFGALKDVVVSAYSKTPSPYVELFQRLAIQAGQPLGGDIAQARRAAKGLFHGKVMKRVTSPVESLRELLSVTEATPRIAELRLKARELGWTPGTRMTPEQALVLTLAAKRVTTDFSAGGSVSKVVSQGVPFFNASIQGARTFARALQERPAQAIMTGLATLTLPALYLWWQNKDEDWYRALPARERWLFWNVPDDEGRVWQIPRPFDWSNLFAVLPEALLDSAYKQDPASIREAFGHIVATQNPLDWPVIGKIITEQYGNRIAFFDRPIVPRGELDLPPGEQAGPYTSWFATVLGRAFPDTISPRRMDALVRGYFGGAVPDLLQAIEQSAGLRPAPTRAESADLPIVGRLFRRGGQYSAANRHLSDFYDLHFYWAEQMRGKNPTTGQQKAAANVYRHKYETIRELVKMADKTQDVDARRRIYRDVSLRAKVLVDDAKKAGLLPEQQDAEWTSAILAPVQPPKPKPSSRR